MNFASDNAGPAHPAVWAAMAAVDRGVAAPYGADPLTQEVVGRLRDLFGVPDAAVALVSVGTAANALALACLCPPWGRILCPDVAHVEWDECGAPEAFIGGGKLVLVPSRGGKITPDDLRAAIAAAPEGVHYGKLAAVTISNLSEMGRAWTPDEVGALAEVAHGAGLALHMDGARFSNAVAAVGCSAAEMFAAGLDALCFGGTKNGLPGVEAVILRDGGLQEELEFRRKRAGHLVSKHRYLAAQMTAYLDEDLWLANARAANAAAARLAEGLRAAGVEITEQVDGNQIFARMPRGLHAKLMAAGASYYLWPEAPMDGDPGEMLGCRMVCNWATEDAEIDALLGAVATARAA